MDRSNAQDTTIGFTGTSTPILADGSANQEKQDAHSKPSPRNSNIESEITLMPETETEALGLLQMRIYDLQSKKFKVLLDDNPMSGKFYMVLEYPGHTLSVKDGRIHVDKKDVLSLMSGK